MTTAPLDIEGLRRLAEEANKRKPAIEAIVALGKAARIAIPALIDRLTEAEASLVQSKARNGNLRREKLEVQSALATANEALEALEALRWERDELRKYSIHMNEVSDKCRADRRRLQARVEELEKAHGRPFCIRHCAKDARREATHFVPCSVYDQGKDVAWKWALKRGWRIRPVLVTIEAGDE